MTSNARARPSAGGSHRATRRAQERVVWFFLSDWGLTVLLVFLIVAVFVIRPLAVLGLDAHLLSSLVFTVMLLSGIATVARSRRTSVAVSVVIVVALAFRWARELIYGAAWNGVNAASAALACGTLAGVVLAQAFREGPITMRRIQGAIAAYLLIALAFAAAFTWVDLHIPHAFTGAAAIDSLQHDPVQRFVYFSFVTLTTVGYGDITPVAPIACSLAMFEALIGQLFPAIMLARLVSMELYYRQREFELDQERREREGRERASED